MANKFTKFNLDEAPVVSENERILEQTGQSRVEQTLTPDPLPLKGEGVITTPVSSVKAKKTENGIVINVPMADYMQLTMMKIQTGRTLKDLALQAIHEFVERNRVG